MDAAVLGARFKVFQEALLCLVVAGVRGLLDDNAARKQGMPLEVINRNRNRTPNQNPTLSLAINLNYASDTNLTLPTTQST